MAKDFLLDEDGDLSISGDLITGDSSTQELELLLLLPKGGLKEYPSSAVGAMTYLESEDTAALLREVRNELAADGRVVKSVLFKNGKMSIDALHK